MYWDMTCPTWALSPYHFLETWKVGFPISWRQDCRSWAGRQQRKNQNQNTLKEVYKRQNYGEVEGALRCWVPEIWITSIISASISCLNMGLKYSSFKTLERVKWTRSMERTVIAPCRCSENAAFPLHPPAKSGVQHLLVRLKTLIPQKPESISLPLHYICTDAHL